MFGSDKPILPTSYTVHGLSNANKAAALLEGTQNTEHAHKSHKQTCSLWAVGNRGGRFVRRVRYSHGMCAVLGLVLGKVLGRVSRDVRFDVRTWA